MENRGGSTSWIPDERTLICKQCGSEQTFSNKYSYRRAMGISRNPSDLSNCKIENAGLCGKCRRSAKRNWDNVTDEYREQCRERSMKYWSKPENIENARLEAIKKMGYSSLEEYFQSDEYKSQSAYRTYRKAVDKRSRTNLKRCRPDEYKRWKNNTYDGTNYETGLTIEHKTPKSVCYEKGLTVSQAAHINNLEVIPMKDNIKSFKEWEQNRKIYEKMYGYNTYNKKFLIREEWWNK